MALQVLEILENGNYLNHTQILGSKSIITFVGLDKVQGKLAP
jgi:hypothetical protein